MCFTKKEELESMCSSKGPKVHRAGEESAACWEGTPKSWKATRQGDTRPKKGERTLGKE